MPVITAYTRSPSRSASLRRLSATMAMPSPSMVPSAWSENGRQSPDGLSAGVLLKHMYMKMSFIVSAPPAMARSLSPRRSSFTAMDKAENVLAQAASVTQLVPCRSKRLAMRPATTLPSTPGKVLSCHGVYSAEMRAQTFCTSLSGRPASRNAFTQMGRCRRLTMEPSSSCAEVTPSMMLIFSRSMSWNCPRAASSSTCFATMSASSWLVSVAGTMFGGTPHAMGSKSTSGRKAPRFA